MIRLEMINEELTLILTGNDGVRKTTVIADTNCVERSTLMGIKDKHNKKLDAIIDELLTDLGD